MRYLFTDHSGHRQPSCFHETGRTPRVEKSFIFFTLAAVLVSTILCSSKQAEACEIEGVEFPSCSASFADSVASFSPGTGPVSEPPENALGLPDDPNGNVSLGNGGILVIEFVDNRIIDQDDVEGGLDLFVFEAGEATESMDIAISIDGVSFIEVGTISGQPAGLDIGPFVSGTEQFRFLRITDVESNQPQTGSFAGADIEAVGAIGSVEAPPVPSTSPLGLLGLAISFALLGLRRIRSAGRVEDSETPNA